MSRAKDAAVAQVAAYLTPILTELEKKALLHLGLRTLIKGSLGSSDEKHIPSAGEIQKRAFAHLTEYIKKEEIK